MAFNSALKLFYITLKLRMFQDEAVHVLGISAGLGNWVCHFDLRSAAYHPY